MKKNELLCRLFATSLLLLSSCARNEHILYIEDEPVEYATTRSIDDARKELEKLLEDIYGSQTTKGSKSKTIKNAYTLNGGQTSRSGDGEQLQVYVFNFENQEGFALMTANEEMPSLLALAENGEISESETVSNPGFALFLEGVEHEFVNKHTFEEATGELFIRKVYGEWENIVYKPCGYCEVTWGQREPYNSYCPMKDTIRTATGCVATAVAQYMSIHKYPTSYNGYSFNWEEMTAAAEASGCTDEAQDQIARLMFELGKKANLNMEYGVSEDGGSSAKYRNIKRTLKDFGYSDGGELNDYDTETVVAELKSGHCVLAGGYSHKKERSFIGIKVSPEYSRGHMWLCHGLLERHRKIEMYIDGTYKGYTIEYEWYPLCNWGWEGYHDGYYLSNAFSANLNPKYAIDTKNADADYTGTQYNYQYKTTAITGIRK